MNRRGKKSVAADYMVLIGFAAAFFFWVLVAVLDSYVFRIGGFIERLLPEEPNEIWLRLLSMSIIIMLSVYVQVTMRRRRAEEELKEKTLHIDNILRSSTNMAIAATDVDFRIIYYNPMAEKIFGYTEADVIGRTVMEVHTKENVDPSRFERAIEKVRSTGEYRYFVEQEKKEGSRLIESRVSGIWDGKDELIGFVLMSQDVTETRRAEDELRKLSRAVEQSPVSVVITDTRGDIEYVNPKFTEVTGYVREEVIGKNPRILKSGEQPSEYYKELWDTIASGSEWRGEFHNKKKSGELYWERASISPINDEKGAVTHYIAVKEDITEKKRADEALQENERRLKEAEQIAHLGHWELDLTSNRLYWSDEIYRIFAMDPKEFGASYEAFLDAVHPEDRDFVDRSYTDSIRSRTPYDIVHRLLTRDGTVKYVNEKCRTIYDAQGSPLRSLGTVQDVTERRRSEEALTRSFSIQSIVNRLLRISMEDVSVEEMLESVIDEMISVPWLSLESKGGIFLVEEPGELVMKAHRGFSDFIQRTCGRVPFGRCICGRAAASGEVEFAGYVDERHEITYEDLVPHGHYCIPIKYSGKVLGVINLYLKEGHVRDEREEEFLVAIADIVSGMIRRKRAEEALQGSEEKYRSLIEGSTDCICHIDLDGNFIYMNPGGLRLNELESFEDVRGRDCAASVKEQYKGLMKDALDRAREGKTTNLRYASTNAVGRELWWDSTVGPIKDDRGSVVSIIRFSRDITEYRQAEKALKESEEKFQKMTSSATDAIIMMDNEGKISYWNPASERTFGYMTDEAVGQDLHAFIIPRVHYKEFRKGFEKFKKTGHGPVLGKTMELSAIRKDGTEFPVEVSISAVKIEGGWNAIGIIRDITERKRSEETIKRMAYHDNLTGLPNRLLLIDRMNQVLSRQRREKLISALLFLDLDRFKDINDSLGHAAGDELLKTVAERIRKCTRASDTVPRLGGDEFTILVQDIKKVEDVVKVVEKIFSIFNEPFNLKGHEIFVTTSIGVSIYPNDGEDSETLLKNADIAMYRAKDEGRNNYKLYTSAMNESAVERLNLESKLRRAVENEEFLVHYQPQVDIKTGEVIGTEALVRWQEPEKGLVPPGQFIPLAEDTGLIVPIGEWVLRTACAQNKRWQDTGLKPVNIAVNLSIRQFKQKDFVETVAGVLDETGLEPKYLDLELTESIIMKDVEATIEVLRRLKDMGIRLSIDDFGTGYSSLEYLKRMPIDMLKIAQSFVRDITVHQDDALIATAIIRVAHSLDIKVIAEGVETAEQLKLLRNLHCDNIQGYFISRPVPSADVEVFLKNNWRYAADTLDKGTG